VCACVFVFVRVRVCVLERVSEREMGREEERERNWKLNLCLIKQVDRHKCSSIRNAIKPFPHNSNFRAIGFLLR
jgi:hypothetical protein